MQVSREFYLLNGALGLKIEYTARLIAPSSKATSNGTIPIMADLTSSVNSSATVTIKAGANAC